MFDYVLNCKFGETCKLSLARKGLIKPEDTPHDDYASYNVTFVGNLW